MNRRTFLKWMRSAFALTALYGLNSCFSDGSSSSTAAETDSGTNTLKIPDLIEPDSDNQITLTAQAGTTEFYQGAASVTWGYNGAYLGPTIKVQQGTTITFNVVNSDLGETITTHWHGLHIDGSVDGGPHQPILSGETWSPQLEIVQQASTNWYHSHVHGVTSEHVYKGLAGLFLIEDTNSADHAAAGLPSTYGVDDIPLIIQDRNFDADGTLNTEELQGRFTGSVIVVNGTVDPALDVEQRKIRFRLLNGSNARFYDLKLSDGGSFDVIATDGGFLNSAVSVTSFQITPGERVEFVIDFSSMAVGASIVLQSGNLEEDGGVLADTFSILTMNVIAAVSSDGEIPAVLNTIGDVADETTVVDRTFDLGAAQINNTSFDMDVINTSVTKEVWEKWTIAGARHPFHVHGCSFRILTIGGVSPAAEYAGWKDTFPVESVEQAIVLVVKFSYGATDSDPYMYHCHILGHEDAGMMGQFTVT